MPGVCKRNLYGLEVGKPTQINRQPIQQIFIRVVHRQDDVESASDDGGGTKGADHGNKA